MICRVVLSAEVNGLASSRLSDLMKSIVDPTSSPLSIVSVIWLPVLVAERMLPSLLLAELRLSGLLPDAAKGAHAWGWSAA